MTHRQRERFETQLKLADRGDDEATQFIDEDFRALEYVATNIWNGNWYG